MKKERNKYFLRKALLVLYLFSLVPSLLFYLHHDEKIVAFADADSCEKAIFYGIQDHHKEHLSTAQDECLICDHHTVTPQIFLSSQFNGYSSKFYTEYISVYQSYHSIELTGNFNKDPPFLS